MNFKLNCLVLLVTIISLEIVNSAPGLRYKREDEDESVAVADVADLNPVEVEEGIGEGVEREKRKLPEATFAAKNAVLGFVFGKINSFIDAKTRFVDALDRQNVEKNKQYNIESPKPINSFQGLISAVITPKITAITSKIGGLSGSLLGGGGAGGGLGGLFAGSSGSLSGGGDGSSSSSAGIGGVLSSLLRLSGPILSSSSGGNTATIDDDSDESEETTDAPTPAATKS